jgi:uncharacterized damage-inducible protein DinB
MFNKNTTPFKSSVAATEEELALLDEALTEEEIEFLEEAIAEEAHPDTFYFTKEDNEAYKKDPSSFMAALAIKTASVVKTASTAM